MLKIDYLFFQMLKIDSLLNLKIIQNFFFKHIMNYYDNLMKKMQKIVGNIFVFSSLWVSGLTH